MDMYAAAYRLAKTDPEAFAAFLGGLLPPAPDGPEDLAGRACRYARDLGRIDGIVAGCRRYLPGLRASA